MLDVTPSLLWRSLKTIAYLKKLLFSQEIDIYRLILGQNQGLWSQNGDTISPCPAGVFQLMKKSTFRRILAFYGSRKWYCRGDIWSMFSAPIHEIMSFKGIQSSSVDPCLRLDRYEWTLVSNAVSISSRCSPFVSLIIIKAKRKAIRDAPVKRKNTLPPILSCRIGKNWVTTELAPQMSMVAIPIAAPRILLGNISDR